MVFSLNLIALPAEADELIAMATRDKRALANRKETLQIKTEHSVENSMERAAELISAKAALEAANAQIALLPEGEEKEAQITKKMVLDLRIRKLGKSEGKTGAITILETEYDADLHERQIAGMDAFIAAITDYKAKL